MTLGIAWARSVGGIRELVIASDSRLSGGQFWDANPKIMLLPRSDCVISFAGDTNDAYPLMLQAYNAILMFRAAMSRALDIEKLKGHLVRVFNHSRQFITRPAKGQEHPTAPDAIFMFAGYSWHKKQFQIWVLHYDPHLQRFTFRPAGSWLPGHEATKIIAFVGDKEAILDAKTRLVEKLRAKGTLASGGFDMEPFDVLRDIIREGRYPSVGGSPQVVKIYEHMNTVPFGVYWPDRNSGNVTVLGRPLMSYEKVDWRVLDPDRSEEKIRPARRRDKDESSPDKTK